LHNGVTKSQHRHSKRPLSAQSVRPVVWIARRDESQRSSDRDRSTYRLHRKEKDDLNTATLRTQLSTIRAIMEVLEPTDGVEQGLHDKTRW